MAIRRARAGDLQAVIEFIRRTYGTSAAFKDADRLDWQFIRAPFRKDASDDPAIWIAEYDGRVVGTIGVQDSRVRLADTDIPAGWIVDVMVDPEWRGFGLGHRIHDAVMRDRETLVTLTMAPATRRIAERAGAVTLGPARQFVLPASLRGATVSRFLQLKSVNRPQIAPLLRGFAKSGIGPAAVAAGGRLAAAITGFGRSRTSLAGFVIEEIERFPPETDAMWTRIRDDFPAIFDRSAKALNWRFCEAPGLDYRRFLIRRGGALRGYLVTRVGISAELPLGVIADFLAAPDDGDALDALIQLAGNILLPHSEYIEAAASTPAFVAALRRAGFLRARTMRPTVVCADADLRRRIAAAPNGWHFTKGDHDWDQVHPV